MEHLVPASESGVVQVVQLEDEGGPKNQPQTERRKQHPPTGCRWRNARAVRGRERNLAAVRTLDFFARQVRAALELFPAMRARKEQAQRSSPRFLRLAWNVQRHSAASS